MTDWGLVVPKSSFFVVLSVEMGTPSHTSWDHTPSVRCGGNSDSQWDIPSPALSRDSGIGTK